MPKVSVYLPDELYREARDRQLPVSALAQRAIEDAVRRASNEEWVARTRATPPRLRRPVDTAALMDEVREEFGG